ncbi:unnamed protein product [Amoebophrya sp. A25]|nr:unnamed protein product [Amoebophrya sp. A25]|eukprot:GSA25T00016817001.1
MEFLHSVIRLSAINNEDRDRSMKNHAFHFYVSERNFIHPRQNTSYSDSVVVTNYIQTYFIFVLHFHYVFIFSTHPNMNNVVSHNYSSSTVSRPRYVHEDLEIVIFAPCSFMF